MFKKYTKCHISAKKDLNMQTHTYMEGKARIRVERKDPTTRTTKTNRKSLKNF